MDAKKRKKHAPKVNAVQKTFLIDDLWANSKLVERKIRRITMHCFLLCIHCAYLFLFLINFGRIITNVDNT